MDYFKKKARFITRKKPLDLHKVDIAGSIVLNCTTSRK